MSGNDCEREDNDGKEESEDYEVEVYNDDDDESEVHDEDDYDSPGPYFQLFIRGFLSKLQAWQRARTNLSTRIWPTDDDEESNDDIESNATRCVVCFRIGNQNHKWKHPGKVHLL